MEQAWRWFGPKDPIGLAHVREAGATGIVSALHQIPGGTAWDDAAIAERKALIEAEGLAWSVVESIPVTNAIKAQTAEWRHDVDAWKATLRALGLRGVGQVNVLPDRPEIRGMIARVPHLVTVTADAVGAPS